MSSPASPIRRKQTTSDTYSPLSPSPKTGKVIRRMFLSLVVMADRWGSLRGIG